MFQLCPLAENGCSKCSKCDWRGNTLTYTSTPHQIRAEGSEGMPESVPGSKTLISFEEMYMKDSEVRLASLFYFSKSMHAAFNNSQFAAGNTASVCHGKA